MLEMPTPGVAQRPQATDFPGILARAVVELPPALPLCAGRHSDDRTYRPGACSPKPSQPDAPSRGSLQRPLDVSTPREGPIAAPGAFTRVLAPCSAGANISSATRPSPTARRPWGEP